jgi:hypothetical protein
MKDERIDELAGALLTQAAKLLETNKRRNQDYRLINADNGKWTLTYLIETPFGNLAGTYNPLPAVKMMIRDTFDVQRDRNAEFARANFDALFTFLLRLVHNFPTMMRLTLKKHALLSLAYPRYEYEEFLSDRLRAHGQDAPAQRFKDVLDSLPTLKKITEVERRLAGISRSGRPRNKRGIPEVGADRKAKTLRPSSLIESVGGILGLAPLSEYEREQIDLSRKVYKAVYKAAIQDDLPGYLHQDYL